MPPKILLCKLRSLGDTVLWFPVVAAVRKAYPLARLSVLVDPVVKRLFQASGVVDEVWVYGRRRVDAEGLFRRFFRDKTLKHALKRRRFDLAVDFYGSRRSAGFIAAARSAVSIGLAGSGSDGVYDVLVPGVREQTNALELDLRVAKMLGVTRIENMPFRLPLENREKALKTLHDQGISADRKTAVVHPFASCPSKEWFPEKWAKVIRFLRQDGWKVFWSAAPREVERLPEYTEALREKLPVVFPAEILDLAAFYAECRIFLGVDSGPRHLAALVGTPTLTIFGPEKPERWHPYDFKKHPFVWNDVPCRPCGLSVCTVKKHVCLRDLSAEKVVETLLQWEAFRAA